MNGSTSKLLTLLRTIAILLVFAALSGTASADNLIVPSGTDHYLEPGTHSFGRMEVTGNLILSGDTKIILTGPADGYGRVFILNTTGNIVQKGRYSDAGARGITAGPASDGTRGSDSTSGGGPGGSGGKGKNGTPGQPGGDGHPGYSLMITAHGNVDYSGKILLTGTSGADGGLGGSGGRGGNGGDGGIGQCADGDTYKDAQDRSCYGCRSGSAGGAGGRGGDGGNGSHGASGGRGGRGGEFRLVCFGDIRVINGEINVSGGAGGQGGNAGAGGSGGNGARGGAGSCDPAGQGGDGGNAGLTGMPGRGGAGGDAGSILIRASGSILATSTFAVIRANGGIGGTGGNGGGGSSGGQANGSWSSSRCYGAPCDSTGPAGPCGVNGKGGNSSSFGLPGTGGNGGFIKIESRKSIRPSQTGSTSVIRAEANGGRGGTGGSMWRAGSDGHCWYGTAPSCESCVAYHKPEKSPDGSPGGFGGFGGSVMIKARERIRLNGFASGGAGGTGGTGGWAAQGHQYIPPDLVAVWGDPGNGGPGGNGGSGGRLTYTSLIIDRESGWLWAGGGSAGFGGYGASGDTQTGRPSGDAGPAGSPGGEGKVVLNYTEPVFFPMAKLETIPPDKTEACIGETVRYKLSFSNDTNEPIESIMLSTGSLEGRAVPGKEPPSPWGSYDEGRHLFQASVPGVLNPGETLEWQFEVKIRPPYEENTDYSMTVAVSGLLLRQYEQDIVTLTLPLCPAKAVRANIYPDRSCALPGSTLHYTIDYINGSDEDATGVIIQTSAIPAGLDVTGGTVSGNRLRWVVGTLAPGAEGQLAFAVRIHDPWDGDASERFQFDAIVTTAESGTETYPGYTVAISDLSAIITDPADVLTLRRNRVPAGGHVSVCVEGVSPADILLVLESTGRDADTGLLQKRTSGAIPLDGSFNFNTKDDARLVAVETTVKPLVRVIGGPSGGANSIEALSAFYNAQHDILSASLPGTLRLGLNTAADGREKALQDWKDRYPDVDPNESIRHTDAAERFDAVNDIARIAATVARHHYSEVAEGLSGIVSVWDLLPIINAAGTAKIKQVNRVFGALLGNKVVKMGAVTGHGLDMLGRSSVGRLLDRFYLKSHVLWQLNKQIYSKTIKSTNLQEQLLNRFYFQLGSGALADKIIKIINKEGQKLQEELLHGDKGVQQAMEALLALIVEAQIRAQLLDSQDLFLAIGQTGSQDAALAAAANTKTKLQYESSISLIWSDLSGEIQNMAIAARDSALLAQLIPHPSIARTARLVELGAEGVSRSNALMKAFENMMFLFSVVDISTLGMQCVNTGSLDIFEYQGRHSRSPAVAVTGERMPAETFSSEILNQLLALYDQAQTAINTGDTATLADLAEELLPLYQALVSAENLRFKRSMALLLAPSTQELSNEQIVNRVEALHKSVVEAQGGRAALMVHLLSVAIDPTDSEARTDALNTLAAQRAGELKLAAAAASVDELLATLNLPSVPIITRVDAPSTAETGEIIEVTVTLENFGRQSGAEGWVELLLPDDGKLILQSPTEKKISIGEGPTTVTWQIRSARPAQHLQSIVITLYDARRNIVENEYLSLFVSEAAGEQAFQTGQGGEVSSGKGSASVIVPDGAFSQEATILVVPSWGTAPFSGQFAFIGSTAYLIRAVEAATGSPLAGPTQPLTVSLAYEPADIPEWADDADLKLFYSADGQTWTTVGGVVDTKTHRITASSSGLGWYVVGLPDTAPPDAPADLISRIVDGRILLEWSPSASPDVASYRVYGGPAPTAREPVIQTADGRSRSIDAGPASAGEPMWFVVRARDFAGNESGDSNDVQVSGDPAAVLTLRIEPIVDTIAPGGTALYELILTNHTSEPLGVWIEADGAPSESRVSLDASYVNIGYRSAVRLMVPTQGTAPLGDHSLTINVRTSNETFAGSVLLHLVDWSEVNLVAASQGGRVIAFSSSDPSAGWAPESLIDESTQTAWRSLANANAEQWLRFALCDDADYNLTRLRLNGSAGALGDPSQAARSFAVRVSTTTAEEEAFTLLTSGVLAQGEGWREILLATPDAARIVELRLFDNHGHPQHIAAAEFEVFGLRQTRPISKAMLLEAIISGLRILAGQGHGVFDHESIDFNRDGVIDMADVIYGLKKVADF